MERWGMDDAPLLPRWLCDGGESLENYHYTVGENVAQLGMHERNSNFDEYSLINSNNYISIKIK
jgi:hypothetical protein